MEEYIICECGISKYEWCHQQIHNGYIMAMSRDCCGVCKKKCDSNFVMKRNALSYRYSKYCSEACRDKASPTFEVKMGHMNRKRGIESKSEYKARLRVDEPYESWEDLSR